VKPLRTIISILTAVLLAGAAFSVVWYFAQLRPASPDSQAPSRVFTVPVGASVGDTASALERAGLIRHQLAFTFYVLTHGLRTRLQAGNYSLTAARTTSEIAAIISGGQVLRDTIVVPEGASLDQITAIVTGKGIAKDGFRTALEGDYKNDFLLLRPTDAGLEGYLFPDSYSVTGTTVPRTLVQEMLNNFGKQVTPELLALLKAEGLDLHQAVTLASIVEKEVSNAADRPVVAQVFLSRLKAGQSLGSDVTVIYAARQLGKGFDTTLDSPYNTYRYKGLPPGPICSPGLSALQAVARPATTNYLYFLAGKDGKTYFARDYAEHQRNITAHL
jgi:UPF0755 protein